MAVANYVDEHGHYPPAYLADEHGRPKHSWRVLLLPYLEQNGLYQQYDFDEPWDGPNNRKLASQMPRVFALHGPERPGNTTTNYLAVVGPETLWQGSVGVAADALQDGDDQTILFVENLGAGVHWMEPRDLSSAGMDYGHNSPAGISSWYTDPAVVMADGSVYRMTKQSEPDTLRALLTVAGGEPLVRDEQHGWFALADGRLRPLMKP